MESVTSADGTKIAYKQTGDGPPLVLIHGGGDSQSLWNSIQPYLASDATVVVPERRGHGDSGDAEDYSLEREVDDMCAVINSTDGDPVVFGHSFGGLCALEAAQKAPVERLILYEPALLTGEHRHDANLADEMEELLDAGERRQAIKLYLQEAAGAENVENQPLEPFMELTDTIIRQNRAIEQYQLSDDLDISVPTLLLMSEKGPEHLRDGVRTLHETLSKNQLIELDNMGHIGVLSNPERVASEIQSFMHET
jgi:pimeloyl-ACP methyl ester carboxylesterase